MQLSLVWNRERSRPPSAVRRGWTLLGVYSTWGAPRRGLMGELHAAHGPANTGLIQRQIRTPPLDPHQSIYQRPARRFAFSGACVPACQRASRNFARDSALSLICPNRARSRACRPGGHAAGGRCTRFGAPVSAFGVRCQWVTRSKYLFV